MESHFTTKLYYIDKIFFLKMGQSRPLFVYICSFLVTISIQIEKTKMVCLGFEPGAAGL